MHPPTLKDKEKKNWENGRKSRRSGWKKREINEGKIEIKGEKKRKIEKMEEYLGEVDGKKEINEG